MSNVIPINTRRVRCLHCQQSFRGIPDEQMHWLFTHPCLQPALPTTPTTEGAS